MKEISTAVKKLKISGLVLMGDKYQIKEALKLANYMIECGIKTNVIFVPLEAEANFCQGSVDFSIGFDS